MSYIKQNHLHMLIWGMFCLTFLPHSYAFPVLYKSPIISFSNNKNTSFNKDRKRLTSFFSSSASVIDHLLQTMQLQSPQITNIGGSSPTHNLFVHGRPFYLTAHLLALLCSDSWRNSFLWQVKNSSSTLGEVSEALRGFSDCTDGVFESLKGSQTA